MLGIKRRSDSMIIGSKKRSNMAMLGSAKNMQAKNPLAISTGTSAAQQKSVLERMTKTGQNLGEFA